MRNLRGLSLLLILSLSSVWAQDYKTAISLRLSQEDYWSIPNGSQQVAFIKFSLILDNPNTVYFQDSHKYPFHFPFVRQNLPGFSQYSEEEFRNISEKENKRILLGTLLKSHRFPGPNEYAFQLVSETPLSSDTVLQVSRALRSSLLGDDLGKALYMPILSQTDAANSYKSTLMDSGVDLVSTGYWSLDSECYSEGWTFGRVVNLPKEQDLMQAYLQGSIRSDDIVLLRSQPRSLPPLRGILSLESLTPNSHVVLLASSFGIPMAKISSEQAAEILSSSQTLLYEVHRQFGECRVQTLSFNSENEALKNFLQEQKAYQTPQISPAINSSVLLEDVSKLTLADINRFGGKSTYFSQLRKAIPENSPFALALSFNPFLQMRRDLSQEIAKVEELKKSTNLDQIEETLKNLRKIIKKYEFSESFKQQVQQKLLQHFEPTRKIRFRSSTNVEDSKTLNGAGLYESYSGCLADELDSDEEGPSLCDSNKEKERGVFRAIKKVFASFYGLEAFLFRTRYKISEEVSAMAILVHYSFPDENELANGVALLEPTKGPGKSSAKIVTQLGAHSITNADGSTRAETLQYDSYSFGPMLDFQQRSNLVEKDATVLSNEYEYTQLFNLLYTTAESLIQEDPSLANMALDYEFKKMRGEGLIIKQVRPLPTPEIPAHDARRFFYQQDQTFCTFQGEGSGGSTAYIMGHHRLKTRLTLKFHSKPFSPQDSALDLIRGLSFEGLVSGRLINAEIDNLEKTPEGLKFTVAGEEYFLRASRGASSRESFKLIPLANMNNIKLSLSKKYRIPTFDKSPYRPDFLDIAQESVELDHHCPNSLVSPGEVHKEYEFRGTFGEKIEVNFTYPKFPTGIIAGYTSPLQRWKSVRIKGLTQEDIVLSDYYALTFFPTHHNFTEYFLIEPGLDPALTESQRSRLRELGIQKFLIFRGGSLSSENEVIYIDYSGNVLQTL